MFLRFDTYQFRLRVSALLTLFSLTGSSQISPAYNILTPPEQGIRTLATVVDGDTLPFVNLQAVDVYTEFVFKSKRHHEQWTRIKHNVKVVYPYAIMAAAKLKEYDRKLSLLRDEKQKKEFIKVCEKDLRAEFEEELKALTISQGKILMKLIDRETGKTTYDVVKQLRGGFQASMWQTVARIFGHNLKVEYDAGLEDIMIERAIKLVEEGRF